MPLASAIPLPSRACLAFGAAVWDGPLGLVGGDGRHVPTGGRSAGPGEDSLWSAAVNLAAVPHPQYHYRITVQVKDDPIVSDPETIIT